MKRSIYISLLSIIPFFAVLVALQTSFLPIVEAETNGPAKVIGLSFEDKYYAYGDWLYLNLELDREVTIPGNDGSQAWAVVRYVTEDGVQHRLRITPYLRTLNADTTTNKVPFLVFVPNIDKTAHFVVEPQRIHRLRNSKWEYDWLVVENELSLEEQKFGLGVAEKYITKGIELISGDEEDKDKKWTVVMSYQSEDFPTGTADLKEAYQQFIKKLFEANGFKGMEDKFIFYLNTTGVYIDSHTFRNLFGSNATNLDVGSSSSSELGGGHMVVEKTHINSNRVWFLGILFHEFAHNFAGLHDEYQTSRTTNYDYKNCLYPLSNTRLDHIPGFDRSRLRTGCVNADDDQTYFYQQSDNYLGGMHVVVSVWPSRDVTHYYGPVGAYFIKEQALKFGVPKVVGATAKDNQIEVTLNSLREVNKVKLEVWYKDGTKKVHTLEKDISYLGNYKTTDLLNKEVALVTAYINNEKKNIGIYVRNSEGVYEEGRARDRKNLQKAANKVKQSNKNSITIDALKKEGNKYTVLFDYTNIADKAPVERILKVNSNQKNERIVVSYKDGKIEQQFNSDNKVFKKRDVVIKEAMYRNDEEEFYGFRTASKEYDPRWKTSGSFIYRTGPNKTAGTALTFTLTLKYADGTKEEAVAEIDLSKAVVE